MIIFNKLDNYFVVSADSQTLLGFEMTANFRDTSPLSFLRSQISLAVLLATFQCLAITHFTVVYLVTWPLSGSEAEVDTVSIQTSLP